MFLDILSCNFTERWWLLGLRGINGGKVRVWTTRLCQYLQSEQSQGTHSRRETLRRWIRSGSAVERAKSSL